MIFVDVDDTLVLWQPGVSPNPLAEPTEKYFNPPWIPNTRLIEGLRAYKLENPATCNIVVWSGGGIDYARMWVRRLDLEDIVTVFEKSINNMTAWICEDDIVIDDMAVYGRTHKPHEWPEE